MPMTRPLLALLAVLIAPAALPAQPVMWPGNGHHYELVSPPAGINWTDARAAAAGRTFGGVSGSLAVLTSAAEWQFVQTTFPKSFTWIGLTDEVAEGTFRWVTGEPVTFTAWLPGEPNNS